VKSLQGKRALITGSSRGIGQQIALGLAQVRSNVIVHGRTLDSVGKTLELLERYEIETSAVACDLGTDEGVKTVVQGVLDGPGYIDVLYNNAAIMNEWQPVWEIPKRAWQDVFQVNVFALIALCNAFAPGMLERGFGRIINLTSGIKDTPQLSPYSISKAAVDKYTEDLAAELRGSNVLVNALDPGWLRTEMGGPDADHDVTTVLPGALEPALLEDHGPSGQRYAAQDFRSDGTS
jgi:NAD(P)-dependent dehydrogenase (short-subunit alcohol dehydrogenase family)